jgi:hypothetical protein
MDPQVLLPGIDVGGGKRSMTHSETFCPASNRRFLIRSTALPPRRTLKDLSEEAFPGLHTLSWVFFVRVAFITKR